MAKKVNLDEKDDKKKKDSKKTTKVTKSESASKTSAKKKVTVKEVVKEEPIIVSEEVTPNEVVNKPKKNIYSIILVIATFLLIVVAFIISVNETKEKGKYYNPVSFSEFQEMISDDKLDVIYWASPSCSYCLQFKPVVLDVSYKYKVTFNYLNTSTLTEDEYNTFYKYLREYSNDYSSNNLGTPSLVLFKNNKIVSISTGSISEDQLVTYLTDQELIEK